MTTVISIPWLTVGLSRLEELEARLRTRGGVVTIYQRLVKFSNRA